MVYRILTGCLIIISLVPNAFAQDMQFLPDVQEVVLKPQMRAEPLSSTLYAVSTDDLIIYLDNILLFESKEEYDRLPYVVGFDRYQNMGAMGDLIFVRGIKNEESSAFSLLNTGRTFIDPITKKEIGLEVDVIGTAELQSIGDPQTLIVTQSLTQIDEGTRLIPRVGLDIPETINARYPDRAMCGFILSVENDTVGVGNYSVAVVNLGAKDGLFQGAVLDLVEGTREIKDMLTYKNIDLPEAKFGEIMIYKVGKKISLGIITFTKRAVVINDRVEVIPADYE